MSISVLGDDDRPKRHNPNHQLKSEMKDNMIIPSMLSQKSKVICVRNIYSTQIMY